MTDADQNQRRRIYFSGRVQGVGFRATTCNIAEPLEVTGTVRNLNDGRVEVVVEGQSKEVERFLQQIRSTMARNIRGEEVLEERFTGEFDSFDWTH